MEWGKTVTNVVHRITESFATVYLSSKILWGMIELWMNISHIDAGENHYNLMHKNNGADIRLYVEYVIRKEFI